MPPARPQPTSEARRDSLRTRTETPDQRLKIAPLGRNSDQASGRPERRRSDRRPGLPLPFLKSTGNRLAEHVHIFPQPP